MNHINTANLNNDQQKILALSSSRVGDSGYLELALPAIREMLGDEPLQIAFIPFAAVDGNYEDYASKVREGLQSLPHSITAVKGETAKEHIKKADVIMVGGGNSFKLLHDLHQFKLLDIIRDKVSSGTPYIGWSAGANMLAPGIFTTNDMPVIEPESFNALGLLPFQINPHYTDAIPAGHRGETRDQRLEEFVILNPGLAVLGLPEGTAVQLLNGKLTLLGNLPAFLFETGPGGIFQKKELAPLTDLSFLM